MGNRRVIAASNAEQLSTLAGNILIDVTKKAVQNRGRAVILVSGGTSIWRSYEAFGKSTDVDWTKVFVFWGDDRFVEPENPYSNYGQVRDALLSHAKDLPKENVFPINSSASTPTQCAEEYSRTIKEFFDLADGQWPVFDLAQNGMGPDGHTASIFPHSPAVHVDDRIAVMNHASLKPWVDRITLTFPVFNHARTVLFITSGAAKATTLKEVLEGSPNPDERPAAHINPINGQVLWLIDESAASELTIPLETDY